MRAYKFKNAAQADHIFDILLNKRLFCAEWRTLNDPMEGMFAYSYRGKEEARPAQDIATSVQAEMQSIRVCSLTSTYDSHLLWAHYANGFNGVAIGLDLPDHHVDIKQIEYRGVFGQYAYASGVNAKELSRRILGSKYEEWAYEKEVRIFSNDTWFHLPKPIPLLIVGHRVHPALFDALQIICEREKIDFSSVGIGDEGIDADFVEPFEDRISRRAR